MEPKVGLALGSGGLRGLAHVGVLRILEQERIPVSYLAGCSIGSLVGALYSSGHDANTIYKLATHLKRRHWLDFVVPRMGVIAGERVLETTQLLTQRKQFKDLRIPLSIIATNLRTGQEVVFNDGDVAAAVRASISVPGVFVPFQLGDDLYVDGAVTNPTPIDTVRKMGADVVIAVDLALKGVPSPIANLLDVMIQSIDIMEKQMFNHRQDLCDILIQPAVGHISPSSFDSIDECVALGEKAALDMMPQIKECLQSFST